MTETGLISSEAVMDRALLWTLPMAGGDRGFSLIEALVAMTIMLVGVLPLAQLMAMSTQSNAAARANSLATLLAVSKIEALRSIDWGGAGLAPSPAGTLSANTAGYVEYLDSRGAVLNVPGFTTGTPPAGAAYVRRWAVDAPPAIPNAVVIQVVVRRSPDRGAPDAARVTTVRTRKEG